jgi:hypothetical protein
MPNSVTSTQTVATETNTKLYNNQKYQIDIVFSNLQGNSLKLNLASLVSLEIEEDSREWYKKATLVIKNPDNILESKPSADTPLNQYYKFRGDGRDIVFITIKPINDSVLKETDLSIDYDVWGMNYTFVIYDRKEILTGTTTKQKHLRLSLWEYDYQIFAESNLDWSTNELLDSKIIPSQATDEEKLVPTGNALKSLIVTALQGHNNSPKFSKEWDIGSSKIFYSSFANNTVLLDIAYLLKKHVSSQVGSDGGADPAILSRTRFTQQWQLRSLSYLFSKAIDRQAQLPSKQLGQATVPTAGSLQREIITLVSQGGREEAEYIFRLPVSPFTSTTNKNTNYQDAVRSRMTNMQIVDMTALDSTYELITSPCYSNNFKNKVFEVDFENNAIENVKKYIDRNYTNKLKLLNEPQTLLALNKAKIQTKSLRNSYSFGPDRISRLAESRNMLLLASVFYNIGLYFNAPGSTIRQANTFISVDNGKGGVKDEFHNKLLGQWFVYNVIHRFTETDYTNTINAVRVHANDYIGIKDDIT